MCLQISWKKNGKVSKVQNTRHQLNDSLLEQMTQVYFNLTSDLCVIVKCQAQDKNYNFSPVVLNKQ